MATVQDYLNLALSATISNQSKTDVEFQLPNDIRKLTDLKVNRYQITRTTLAAGATTQRVGSLYTASSSLMLVFFSHPVLLVQFQGTSTTTDAMVTFVGVWTDRSDGTNSANLNGTAVVAVDNTLHSPNYTTTSGGATTAVEATVVEIELSSTA